MIDPNEADLPIPLHKQVNSWEDFLRVSDPTIHTAAAANIQNERMEKLKEEAAQKAARPKRPRATKRQVKERLAALRVYLREGVPVDRIYEGAKHIWNIGKRMTQLYLQRVKRALAEEAAHEDYLAHLWASKLQHEELYYRALCKLDQADDLRQYTALLRLCGQFLKTRDQIMASVVEHRAATNRDQSPDSAAAKETRDKIVSMPLAEWMERLENLKYSWRWEWKRELERPACEEFLRSQGRQEYSLSPEENPWRLQDQNNVDVNPPPGFPFHGNWRADAQRTAELMAQEAAEKAKKQAEAK